MFSPNYYAAGALTRPPSRCRRAGFLAPIATRQIRFGTGSVIPDRSRGSATRLSKYCWLATANRNSSRSSGASSNPWRLVAGRLQSQLAGDRFTRATVRVALRQLKALDQTSPALAEWLSAHDQFEAVEAENSMEAHH